jgi:hypothetical protein
MDRTAFLLEREEIQRRMESRRLETSFVIASRQTGLIPRLLRSGTGLLFGLGPQGESLSWVSSLLWAVLTPALLGVAQRGGDALVQKLIHVVFPGKSIKEPSSKSSSSD